MTFSLPSYFYAYSKKALLSPSVKPSFDPLNTINLSTATLPNSVTQIFQAREAGIYTPVYTPLLMPVQFTVKLAKVGNSFRLTIPKPIVKGFGLKEGDMMILSVAGGDEIKIRKSRRSVK